MINDYELDYALDKIKRMDIKIIDNTRFLIDTDDKLSDHITLNMLGYWCHVLLKMVISFIYN